MLNEEIVITKMAKIGTQTLCNAKARTLADDIARDWLKEFLFVDDGSKEYAQMLRLLKIKITAHLVLMTTDLYEAIVRRIRNKIDIEEYIN